MEKKPFTCKLCYKAFSQSGQVLAHVRKEHDTGEKPISCTFCQKTFTAVGNLKSHQKMHSSEKEVTKTLPAPKEAENLKQNIQNSS